MLGSLHTFSFIHTWIPSHLPCTWLALTTSKPALSSLMPKLWHQVGQGVQDTGVQLSSLTLSKFGWGESTTDFGPTVEEDRDPNPSPAFQKHTIITVLEWSFPLPFCFK